MAKMFATHLQIIKSQTVILIISFTCLKSRQNKVGQSPFKLWVNVDGTRATTIMSLRAAPPEFQKAMKSKIGHEIQYGTSYKYCLVVERFEQ